MKARRVSMIVGCLKHASAVAIPLGLCGCGAAVIGGIVAVALMGGGGGGGGTSYVRVEDVAISSVSPRESAVVGGVEVEIRGQNFDRGAQVSFGSQAAVRTVFVDTMTLRATVPFNDIGGKLDIQPDIDESTYDPRYTETSAEPLRLRVVTADHGAADSPFWYSRPRLTTLDPAYGNLGAETLAVLRGSYCGFARDISDTHVYLIFPDGSNLAIPPESLQPNDPACTTDPCSGDPHQGSILRVLLPRRSGAFSELRPGPGYGLRVVSENGLDEMELGYAPPYPPRNFTCRVRSRAVELTWIEDADDDPADGNEPGDVPFDRIFIQRDRVSLAVISGGIGSYTDGDVESTVYSYRIYGEKDGYLSPAVTCDVAVLPDGLRVDPVLEIGSKPRIPRPFPLPLVLGGAIAEAQVAPGSEPDSAELIYRALERIGRAPFLFRSASTTQSFSGVMTSLLKEGRVGVTFITAGDAATFAKLDEEGFKALDQYYTPGRDGGVCLEGQHVIAAVDASPALGALVRGRLGSDPQEELQSFDGVSSVRVLPTAMEALQWSGGNGGVTGLRPQTVEARQLKPLLEARPQAEGQAFTAALASTGSRFVLSFLHLSSIQGGSLPREELAAEILRAYLGELALTPEPRRFADGLTPTEGFVGESTRVTITGGDLSLISEVLFGLRPGTISSPRTSTTLRVDTPRVSLPGVVPVILRDASGENQSVAGQFTFKARAMSLSGLSPNSGPTYGKTRVVIRGQNFTPAPDLTVRFGERYASVVSVSRTGDEVVCLSPPAAAAGQVTVTVQTQSNSATGSFTYVAVQGPRISSINPPCCKGLGQPTPVEIRGSGFTKSTRVFVCGARLPAQTIVSEELIQTTMPAMSSGNCDVLLENEAGVSNQAVFGCPCGPAPVILSIEPGSGPAGGGTQVVITGKNFTPDMAVTICGVPVASYTFQSATAASVITPAGTGVCPVQVENGNGFDILAAGFEYLAQAPAIDSVGPASGIQAGGESIQIVGRNFTPDTVVRICGNNLSNLVFVSSTEIRGLTPPGLGNCTCDVTAGNSSGTGTLTGGFSYGPFIGSISQSSGPDFSGALLVIQGSCFAPRTIVSICNEALGSQTFISSTEIRGTAPGGCGACPVTVRTGDLSHQLDQGYTYRGVVLTSIVPNSGPEGGNISVTVNGQNFTDRTEVRVCGNPISIQSRSATQITGVVGAGSGVCDVAASNTGGECPESVLRGAFTYQVPPLDLLFLGSFGFDLDNPDSVRGGTDLRDFLTLGEGHSITEIADTTVTTKTLGAFDVVFFSRMPSRLLTGAEAAAFGSYIESGGGVFLLGQIGLSESAVSDKNAIAVPFGITFNQDLFADPLLHLNYSGGCTPGDPDGGWEYALLSQGGFVGHPVTAGITSVLLNWGQTLSVSSPALAIARGSSDSFGDGNPVFQKPAGCPDGWYVNGWNRGEPRGEQVGMAVAEFGKGRLLALGDQDLFWNFHFNSDRRRFVRNALAWLSD